MFLGSNIGWVYSEQRTSKRNKTNPRPLLQAERTCDFPLRGGAKLRFFVWSQDRAERLQIAKNKMPGVREVEQFRLMFTEHVGERPFPDVYIDDIDALESFLTNKLK